MKLTRSIRITIGLLKLCAILIVINAFLGFGSGVQSTLTFNNGSSVAVRILGTQITISRDLYQVINIASRLLDGIVRGVLLWGAAEALYLLVQTEAYARGTYSLSRKRSLPDTSRALIPKVTEQKKKTISGSQPAFEIREPTSADLQYSPPERYRRQQLRSQGAPARRVTVFRNRSDNTTHEPRPAGQIEAVDSLDAQKPLPFDRV